MLGWGGGGFRHPKAEKDVVFALGRERWSGSSAISFVAFRLYSCLWMRGSRRTSERSIRVDHNFHSGPLVLTFHHHALRRIRCNSFRGTVYALYKVLILTPSSNLQGHQGRLEEIGCWIFRERLQRSTVQTGVSANPPAHPTRSHIPWDRCCSQRSLAVHRL